VYDTVFAASASPLGAKVAAADPRQDRVFLAIANKDGTMPFVKVPSCLYTFVDGAIVSCPSLPPAAPPPFGFRSARRFPRLAFANRIDSRPSGDRLVRQRGNAPVRPANKL
jgi:hypothetical protein